MAIVFKRFEYYDETLGLIGDNSGNHFTRLASLW